MQLHGQLTTGKLNYFKIFEFLLSISVYLVTPKPVKQVICRLFFVSRQLAAKNLVIYTSESKNLKKENKQLHLNSKEKV